MRKLGLIFSHGPMMLQTTNRYLDIQLAKYAIAALLKEASKQMHAYIVACGDRRSHITWHVSWEEEHEGEKENMRRYECCIEIVMITGRGLVPDTIYNNRNHVSSLYSSFLGR